MDLETGADFIPRAEPSDRGPTTDDTRIGYGRPLRCPWRLTGVPWVDVAMAATHLTHLSSIISDFAPNSYFTAILLPHLW